MPRNAAGVYTLPLPPVTPNTVIESDWANATMDDIAATLQDSLSRSGQGGMLGAFRVIDGNVATPGLAFVAETSSGLYRIGSGDVGMSVLGVLKQQWTNNGIVVSGTAALQGDVTITGAISVTGGITGGVTVDTLTVTGDASVGGKLTASASTTVRAGFRLTPGVAPTTPVDGDVWLTASNVVARIAGTNRIMVMTSTAQTLSGAMTFTAAAVFNGGVTLGDAAGDALTINSTTATIPAAGLQFAGGGNTFVGINRAPTAQLDVAGTPTSTAQVSALVFNAQSTVTGVLSALSTANASHGPVTASSVMLTVGLGNTPLWVGNWQAGTGYIAFMTNAAERMRITPEGNVGVNTATPTNYGANFRTVSINAVTGATFEGLINGTKFGSFFVGATQAVLGTDTGSNIPLLFITNGNEKARITVAGDTGFGHTPPNYGAGARVVSIDASINSIIDMFAAGVRQSSYSVLTTKTIFGTITATPLEIWANSLVRMTIGSNGNLGIGMANDAASPGSLISTNVTGTPPITTLIFRVNTAIAGSINHPTGTTTAFNTSSDARLKRNVRPAKDVGRIIDNIPVVSFDWKTDGIHVPVGMIAQDVHGVFPQAVHEGGSDASTDPWMLDHSKLVPLLLKEIQSLRQRVDVLEDA